MQLEIWQKIYGASQFVSQRGRKQTEAGFHSGNQCSGAGEDSIFIALYCGTLIDECGMSNSIPDLHNVSKAHTIASSTASSSSSSSGSTSSAAAAAAAAAAISSAAVAAATSSAVVSMASHLAAHQSSSAAHHHAAAQHAHHGHHVAGVGAGQAPPPPPPTHHHMAHAHPHPLSHHAAHHAALASLSMAGLRTVPGGLSLVSGLQAAAAGGAMPEICPVCGLKLSAEEWHTHFLTELDRLYKLSAGFERANLQATYMFAPPCPAQENAIRTSHNRWEVSVCVPRRSCMPRHLANILSSLQTFQRIRNNRQNRHRLKVRKRKFGEMYMMESLYCSSCPICKRKYALETGKLPPEVSARHLNLPHCFPD